MSSTLNSEGALKRLVVLAKSKREVGGDELIVVCILK
jgi:hypothetical protein